MKRLHKKIALASFVIIIPCFFYFFSTQYITTQKVNFTANSSSKPKLISNPYLAELAHSYDSIINLWILQEPTAGLSVAIVYDTTVVLLKGYGVKKLYTKDSIDIHTVYRLASVSKPLASFLAGTFVEDGLLRWQDKVVKHWPDFRLKQQAYANEVTIEQVLAHTTGLPYHTFTNLIEEGVQADTLLHNLREIDLVTKPGEVYSYQNVGFSIIGKVVEGITQKTYQQLLHEKIFVPLGMNTASVSYSNLFATNNFAHPHIFKRGQLQVTVPTNTYYNAAPAGGVNASIADMVLWLQALLGNREQIISSNTLDSLFTPRIVANSRNRNFYKWKKVKQAYYGLGWRVLNFDVDTIVYHGGYVAGYRSEVAVNKKERVAICVLANAPGSVIDNSLPLFFSVFDRYKNSIKNWEAKTKSKLVK
jgi:beta-lactamase class C